MARDGEDQRDSGTLPGNERLDRDFVAFARNVGRELRMRSEFEPRFDEARWMILLDMYQAMGDGRETPFMSAAHASSASVSTAQRYIHEMIDSGLIAQHRSGADQRITHVSLTEAGVALVQNMLSGVIALRARR